MIRQAKSEILSLLAQPAEWWLRRIFEVGIDVGTVVAAAYATCAILATEVTDLGLPLALSTVALLTLFGGYRSASRYFGLSDFLRVIPASLGVFLTALIAESQNAINPFAWPTLCSLLVIVGLSSTRIVRRIRAERTLLMVRERNPNRVLIVGAGDAGEALIRELLRRRNLHQVIGLVDDDPKKMLLSIHGVPVLGVCADISSIAERHRVDEILISDSTITGDKLRSILQQCEAGGIRVRTLPGVATALSGNGMIRALREVDIDDLLRREVGAADEAPNSALIQGESVLITGAGGSIGSELARQIARLDPANLILVGKGENSIFEIDEELKWEFSSPPISIIADVRDRYAMEQIFERHRPSIVFHAAAHKHVPLMQSNIREAIANNVTGTRVVAETAAMYGAKKFICVSTDKAVKPTSIMGATKRVSEMIVSCIAQRTETEMAIVRFGNVLGSRGSLIPILKRQIARGGPVKLTHPEMSRYFMTIPEAVHLVLQAATLGKRGELFLLDMGDPIRIVELAKDLIRLHGLMPGQDIAIEFTGIRPGEKLHEELLYASEELTPTIHPKIRMVPSSELQSSEWIYEQVAQLESLCECGKIETARELLMDLAWTQPNTFFVHESHSLAS